MSDFSFEITETRPATKKRPAVATVKVSSESKLIRLVATLMGEIVIFYEEKDGA